MKTRLLVFLFACLSWVALIEVGAQDFILYLPEEDLPSEESAGNQEEVLIVEEAAPVDGFFARLLKVLRGARVEHADGQPADSAFTQGVVSHDPNDPEKKPKGTIFFSFNW